MRQPSLLETKQSLEPQEFSNYVRERGDLYWWAPGNFYVVTRYSLAETVLRSPDYSCDRSEFFISRMPNMDLRLIKDFFGVIRKMMVMSDGKEHLARRRIAAMGVTPELLEHYRPIIQDTVRKLLEPGIRRGSMEFVSEVAEQLPSAVLADLFHIPEGDRKNFYLWSHNMTQFFGGASEYRNEDGEEVNHSATQIRDYFNALLNERRRTPGEDFLSILLENQTHFSLTDEEIVSQAVMMLVAGQITTTDQFCNNLYALLNQPKALSELRNHPDKLPQTLEECTRWDPAVSFLFRVVKNPTELGEQKLQPGDVIFISTHGVNRDPSVVENPNHFQWDRSPNPHMGYGFGPHLCLGAKLARHQLVECFSQLLQLPALQLDPNSSPTRKHHSLAFSGFESLRLKTSSVASEVPYRQDDAKHRSPQLNPVLSSP